MISEDIKKETATQINQDTNHQPETGVFINIMREIVFEELLKIQGGENKLNQRFNADRYGIDLLKPQENISKNLEDEESG